MDLCSVLGGGVAHACVVENVIDDARESDLLGRTGGVVFGALLAQLYNGSPGSSGQTGDRTGYAQGILFSVVMDVWWCLHVISSLTKSPSSP
jgi:hypothetical protein